MIQWSSVLGKTYAIQETTDLISGFAETVSNGISGIGGTNSCVLPVGQEPRKFYRVLLE